MVKQSTKGFSMILVGVILAIIAVGGIVTYKAIQQPSEDMVDFLPAPQTQDTSSQIYGEDEVSSPAMITIQVPVIDGEGGLQNMEEFNQSYPLPQSWYDSGMYVGCGVSVEYVPVQVPYTAAVLNATYNHLFNAPGVITYNGTQYSNIIGSYSAHDEYPMNFESVEIVGSTAKLYLSGTIMNNHCSDPALLAQLRFAATQYPTVDNVEIYLNGSLFNVTAWMNADAG